MTSEQIGDQRHIVRQRVQESEFGLASLIEYSDKEVVFTLSDMSGDAAHIHILTDKEKEEADWTLGRAVE